MKGKECHKDVSLSGFQPSLLGLVLVVDQHLSTTSRVGQTHLF